MLQRDPLLVIFIKMVDRLPTQKSTSLRQRGRPKIYSDQLIIKALIIMIVRRIYSAHGLLAFLDQGTALTDQLKELLHENGSFPCRRTWDRRLKQIPSYLPSQIRLTGKLLIQELQPWKTWGRAVAVDSTGLRAKGGVWHKKDREKGIVPHSSIDTEAHWGKSDYHGWFYGWKLHLATTVSSIWVPLAAEVSAANMYDGNMGPTLVEALSDDVRFVLGDNHYRTPTMADICFRENKILVASGRKPYPRNDVGAKVRQIFHELRSKSIEPFNQLFKNIFDWHNNVPVKGLNKTTLFLLGAVLLYQIVLLYQHENNQDVGRGIKPLLRAA